MTVKGQNNNGPEVIYEKEEKTSYYAEKEGKFSARFIFGLALILLGAFLILKNYIPIDLGKNFWPVVLILFGIFITLRSFRK